MNRYKKTISITADPDNDRLMWYSVTAGASNVIFRGKCYVLRNKLSVTIDVTDIVNNYLYKGCELLTPTWNATAESYLQPYGNTTSTRNLVLDGTQQEYDVEDIVIKIYSESTYTNQVGSGSISSVYFHSIAPEDEKIRESVSDYLAARFDTGLLPHLPNIATTKLRYGQLVKKSSAHTDYWYWGTASGGHKMSLTYTNAGSYVCSASLYTIKNWNLPDNTLYSMGNSNILRKPMLKLDDCARPYYLLWLNPNGGFQSYGFEKTTVPVENYTTNYRLTMDDYSYKANQTLNQRYRLKTGLVTDAEYKVLLTAARSPYCVLYITELDRVYYVNVTNTSMEHKTYTNQNKKLFNFECEVELAEKDFQII